MIVFFTETDLISFGNYLLSEKRKQRIEQAVVEHKDAGGNPPPADHSAVYDADMQNWMEENNSIGTLVEK